MSNGKRKDKTLNTVYENMMSRCYNTEYISYHNYGGRGIGVHYIWILNKDSFILWCKKNGWVEGFEIDRIDNDIGYNPTNCRFIIHRVNCLNRRIVNSDNSTGYTGIHYAERDDVYIASLTIKGKHFQLGSYKELGEAVIARNKFIVNLGIQKEYKIQDLI